nr:hypothetical protein [Pandoravirus aubagnensis]
MLCRYRALFLFFFSRHSIGRCPFFSYTAHSFFASLFADRLSGRVALLLCKAKRKKRPEKKENAIVTRRHVLGVDSVCGGCLAVARIKKKEEEEKSEPFFICDAPKARPTKRKKEKTRETSTRAIDKCGRKDRLLFFSLLAIDQTRQEKRDGPTRRAIQ